VDAALSQNIGSIAFTYTEPTVFYEYMYDIAQLSREKDIKTVMVSNGFIKHDPLVELCSLINAANIDLKCFDEATYKKLTGGRLSTILETLLTLKQQNVWLEITFLLIPEFNDDLEKIKKCANGLYATDLMTLLCISAAFSLRINCLIFRLLPQNYSSMQEKSRKTPESDMFTLGISVIQKAKTPIVRNAEIY
jgi:Pyruvate-formate lyase-activating enzyme